MGEFYKCEICKEWGWRNNHQCPPLWETNIKDWNGDDDWDKIRARTAEDAAEKIVEEHDPGDDYDCLRGYEVTVKVRKLGEEKFKTFAVNGESIPTYTATEVEDDNDSDNKR